MTQKVIMNTVHRALWPGWQRSIQKLKKFRMSKSRWIYPVWLIRDIEKDERSMRRKAGYGNQILPF